MIRLEAIAKSYGKQEVLNNIFFKIEKGDCIGIIGKNGCGKTTLVNIISKTIKADEGRVLYDFDEKHIYDLIGVQTQEAGFDERLKVRDICNLWASIYNIDKNIMDKYLKDFKLDAYKNKMINTLSGGEKQKLNIILSICHNPDILIFDEITTGLDTISRNEIKKYVKKLRDQGKTILIVSHYMEELEYLCNKILALRDGGILKFDNINEFYNDQNSLADYFEKNMGESDE